jgi:hypothetical protein
MREHALECGGLTPLFLGKRMILASQDDFNCGCEDADDGDPLTADLAREKPAAGDPPPPARSRRSGVRKDAAPSRGVLCPLNAGGLRLLAPGFFGVLAPGDDAEFLVGQAVMADDGSVVRVVQAHGAQIPEEIPQVQEPGE